MTHLRRVVQSASNGDGLGSLGFLDPTSGCLDMLGWILGVFWAIRVHYQAQMQAMLVLTLLKVNIPSNDTVPLFSEQTRRHNMTDLSGEKNCASVNFKWPYLQF